MTREEAFRHLRNDWFMSLGGQLCVDEDKKDAFLEAVGMGIKAFRPVSREQVEKVFPGCDYCKHAWMEGLDLKPCASGNIGVELTIGMVSEDDAFGILAYYRNAAAGYIDFPFCPFCGRPMTDEAVDIIMRRLETLYETT